MMKAKGNRPGLRRLACRLCAAALALLLTAGLGAAACADYIHGYFRYTVEDQSVTITGYFGPETAVTVPAMIGGNPVNAVAADAFRDSAVQVVYLPDTIETVAEGAFAEEQQVYYLPADAIDTRPDPSLGIPTESGGIVTTDDQGNLLLVDESGRETVLSDSGDFTRQTEDGRPVIRSADGTSVSVSGSTVSFSRQGEAVTVAIGEDGLTVSSTGQEADYEEAEADAAEAASAAAPAGEDSRPLSAERLPILLGLGLAALCAGVAVILTGSRRHKKK